MKFNVGDIVLIRDFLSESIIQITEVEQTEQMCFYSHNVLWDSNGIYEKFDNTIVESGRLVQGEELANWLLKIL